MAVESTARKRIYNSKWWLWFWIFFFVSLEWWNIFSWNVPASFRFVSQTPETFSCLQRPLQSRLEFFNFKVWLIVALAQAVVWGTVASVALRELLDLWSTAGGACRWRRRVTGAVAVRALLFGAGLGFLLLFLTRFPQWELGCFKGHLRMEMAGLPAYLAAGLAAIIMWLLEKRICILNMRNRRAATQLYLKLRQELQKSLLMASLVLVFGVIGLVTRRTFLQELSPNSFFPNSIVLEGLEYTLLLALAYAPVHAAFNSVGATLLEMLVPLPAGDRPEDIQDWIKRSNDFGDLMQIRVYDWKSFGPGFPILAPFLMSLLASLLK